MSSQVGSLFKATFTAIFLGASNLELMCSASEIGTKMC